MKKTFHNPLSLLNKMIPIYHDFKSHHKDKCNRTFLQLCRRYLGIINMIILDGPLLQTTRVCHPYAKNIRVIEASEETVNDMNYQSFIHQYYDKTRIHHSLLSDFVKNPKNDLLLENFNAMYMDTMNTVEGSRTHGVFPLQDIEDFLLSSKEKTIVLGCTFSKRCNRRLMNAYHNITEQYESFLFNVITYCQFRIRVTRRISYRRQGRSMPMICFIFLLEKDETIDSEKVDFHVEKYHGKRIFLGYP